MAKRKAKSGDKGRRAPSGLTERDDARLDRLALAKGWLKRPNGKGLDADKLATLIDRNYERALTTEDDRALASLTKNVISAVGQVMDQEKRDLGLVDRLDITSGGQPLTKILQATRDFDPDAA